MHRSYRLALILFAAFTFAAAAAERPNIIYILCDDLGYGDVRALNPQGKIATPNMDRLAASGIAFTDCHSSSAVCSPTRYGILTGRYNWRSRLKKAVLQGYSPRLIEPGRLTIADFLKKHGYATAAIGKWHLGMDFPLKTGGIAHDYSDEPNINFTKPIVNGPTTVGFDYYFGISASLDMPPYTFIENDRIFVNPTAHQEKWGNVRAGAKAPDFVFDQVLPTVTAKAIEWIDQHAADARSGKQPLFLYLPLNAPHTPIVPTKDWQGKSNLNAYGDYVMETDWAVGQVLQAIDKAGLTDSTLLVMTSDNGCSPQANFPELLAKGHNPSYVSRGYKADIYDGGHHIPFFVRWPGHIKPGSTTGQIACLTDFFATVADVFGEKLPDTAAEDSVSLLPVLTNPALDKPLREAIVHHSIDGCFAIRQGNWKLELCPGSGGWSAPRDPAAFKEGLPPIQLYDMRADVAEKNNVQSANPEIVERLTKLLEKYVNEGRSTPGAAQQNTTPVNIYEAPEDSKQTAQNAAPKRKKKK
jgi:arylsulfatase A